MLMDIWQHLFDLLMWLGLRPPMAAASGDGEEGETLPGSDPNG